MRRHPLLLLACAAALIAASTGVNAAPVSDCPTATTKTGKRGQWTTYAPPAFAVGAKAITAHAIDPAHPDRWYATNGKAVAVSRNGGCTWESSFTLPATPQPDLLLTRETASIRHIAVPRHGEDRAYLAIAGGDAAHALVRTTDGGKTWTQTAELPVKLGPLGPLAVAPSDGDRVYLGTGGLLQVSHDGGKSFDAHVVAATPEVPAGVTGDDAVTVGSTAPLQSITIAPGRADDVWVRSSSTYFHSLDGGASFTALTGADVPRGDGAVGPAFTRGRPGGPPALMFIQAQGADGEVRRYYTSDSAGASLEPRDVEPFGGRIEGFGPNSRPARSATTSSSRWRGRPAASATAYSASTPARFGSRTSTSSRSPR